MLERQLVNDSITTGGGNRDGGVCRRQNDIKPLKDLCVSDVTVGMIDLVFSYRLIKDCRKPSRPSGPSSET
ncbi:hypothetical protein J6590_096866 [Homalodisca vitripennis]|nr:hypothetical protein J6590_096866 [Homalodisca vitripennis]